MGTSTFSEYTVLPEIIVKISKEALIKGFRNGACGTNRHRRGPNTAKVEAGASVAVFGLGAVGMAVIRERY